jgi:hypothetical protein
MVHKANIAVGTLVGCLFSTGLACKVSFLIRAYIASPLGFYLPIRERNPAWNVAERSHQFLFMRYHFQSSLLATPVARAPVE